MMKILFGIIAGIIVSIGVGYLWGPRSRIHYINEYTGCEYAENTRFWHYWRTESSDKYHVEWAKSEMTDKHKSLIAFIATEKRGWFGFSTPLGGAIDTNQTNVVKRIYYLPIPDNRKRILLREFHKVLDLKKQEHSAYGEFIRKIEEKYESR